MNGENPDAGNDAAPQVSSLRSLLAREGPLQPARAAAIIASLAAQLDAVPPSSPRYGGIGLDTISVTPVPGAPDVVRVLDWDLGGAVTAEGTTAQARAQAAHRSLAAVAAALLTGRQPEAPGQAARLVLARGLPPASAALLERALDGSAAHAGGDYDNFREFAAALDRTLRSEPPAAPEPVAPEPVARRQEPWPQDTPPADGLSDPGRSSTPAVAAPPANQEPKRSRRLRIVVAFAVVGVLTLAISLPVILTGARGLNERTWQGLPGAPAVSALTVTAGSEPQLGNAGDLWGSSDGTRLLTVDSTGFDNSGAVTALNLRSGAVTKLPALTGYAGKGTTTPFGFAASPDLTTLAAADTTDIFIEQAATGHLLADIPFSFGIAPSVPLGGAGVPGVAFSPDGTLLAVNDVAGNVHLYNVPTGQEREVLHQPAGSPGAQVSGTDALAFSPDGGVLAAGTEAGPIYLWDVADGALLATLTDPNSSPGNQYPNVTSLAFADSGSLLLAGNLYGTVSVWDVPRHRLLGVLPGTPGGQDSSAGQILVSPDGSLVAVAFQDGTIRFWSVADGRRLAVISDAVVTNVTNSIAFGLGGRLLVSFDGAGPVTEWTLSASSSQ